MKYVQVPRFILGHRLFLVSRCGTSMKMAGESSMFVFYSSISQYALEGCTRRLQPTIISVVYECGIVSQWWTAAGKWPSHPRVLGLGDLPLTCGCQAEPVRGIFRSELSSDWECSLQGLASPSPCSLGLQQFARCFGFRLNVFRSPFEGFCRHSERYEQQRFRAWGLCGLPCQPWQRFRE